MALVETVRNFFVDHTQSPVIHHAYTSVGRDHNFGTQQIRFYGVGGHEEGFGAIAEHLFEKAPKYDMSEHVGRLDGLTDDPKFKGFIVYPPTGQPFLIDTRNWPKEWHYWRPGKEFVPGAHYKRGDDAIMKAIMDHAGNPFFYPLTVIRETYIHDVYNGELEIPNVI